MTNKRYETKFRITELSFHEIEYILKKHPAIFKEIHYKRMVNNIYFDTLDLNNFRDNVEGERDRIKIRIRWYGDLFGEINKPCLEIKNKCGLLGWKDKYELEKFTLNKENYFDYKRIFNKIASSGGKDWLKLNTKLIRPTLMNNYERKYFLSNNGKFRITLDKNMNFYSINPYRNHIKTFEDSFTTILELKYEQQDFAFANKITQSFPFRVTKSSKYIVGVDNQTNW